MGGGGSAPAAESTQSSQYSSTSELPAYLKAHHEDILDDAEQLWVDYLAASPFALDVAYDPTTHCDEVGARFTSFQTFVDGLDGTEDWKVLIEEVTDKIDALWSSISDEVSDVVTDTMALVSSSIDTAIANAVDNGIDIATAVQSFMDDEIHGLITDMTSPINTAIQSIQSSAGLGTIADTVITDAATAAITVMNSAAITGAATAYEVAARPAYLRSVGRFTAGMSDVNAVNQTSFIIGVALLEKQFTDQVDKFHTDLKLETYRMGYQSYVDLFQKTLGEYIQAFVGILTTSLSTHGQMSATISKSLEGVTSTQIETFQKAFTARIGAVLDERKLKAEYINRGIDTVSKNEMFKGTMEGALNDVALNANKLKIDSYTDMTDKQMQIDEMDTKWPFYLMAFRGDALSAINGAPMNSSSSGSSSSSRKESSGGGWVGTALGIGSMLLGL